MTDNYSEAIQLLQEAETIAIFMHVNPDPDCIGSSLALYTFLRKQGKKVYSFTPDTRTTDMIMSKNEFLPNFSHLNKCDVRKFDLSVAVDLGETHRIGDLALPLFYKGERSLVIDHHETFKDFADVTVRETTASSTAQILYKILAEYDKSCIDKNIATLLYAGLVTDSGNFSFDSTSQETFEVARELNGYGIPLAEITRKLTKDESYNVYRLKSKVLPDARFFNDRKIAVISFFKDDFLNTGTTEKDTDGIINLIQNINSVLIAVSISEVGNRQYKISFRSKGTVSARACAEVFGGGGHLNASGCRLSGEYLDVLNKLVEVARSKIIYV